MVHALYIESAYNCRHDVMSNHANSFGWRPIDGGTPVIQSRQCYYPFSKTLLFSTYFFLHVVNPFFIAAQDDMFAPANNHCVDAMEIFNGNATAGTNLNATFDFVNQGTCGPRSDRPSVWYVLFFEVWEDFLPALIMRRPCLGLFDICDSPHLKLPLLLCLWDYVGLACFLF
jgi:hypothetical protein